MKKALSLILALITLCLALCSCGKKEDDLSQYMPQKHEKETLVAPREENAKGSRSNPYSLGDEIVFNSVDLSLENMYQTTIEINELSSGELDLAKSVYKKFWGHVCNETYEVSFKIECLKGDNSEQLSDRTDSGGCFLKYGLDANMQETHFDFFNKTTGEKVYDLYPDTEYNLYMTADDRIDCKYLTLKYCIDEYKTETIWIKVK